MTDVSEHLKSAAKILHGSGITEPRREARSLLAFALQKNKTFLLAHPEYNLSNEEEKRFLKFLKRRANREPLQYIRGTQEFYRLDFSVTKDVLIPRPETELIVEMAIEILREKENPTFCEVGIGTGCIAVSILQHIKTARAAGFDVSRKALKIAEKNAETHKVLNRLSLKVSDVFGILRDEKNDENGKIRNNKKNEKDEKFDLIVANPPYIAGADVENLQREVRDFEPLEALTDGKDGFSIIEKIIIESPLYLKKNGFLLLEIGFNQAEKVRSMFSAKIWRTIEILPDLQGIPRTVKAQIEN